MTKKAYYKELNEKVAILEAVLRKKLNAPMAMVEDASSEQKEEHIAATIDYLFNEDLAFNLYDAKGEKQHYELSTKVFDSAMTKACFEYLSNYMHNLPKALAELNQEKLGSIYPFTNESNCDLVDDAFVKRISFDIDYFYGKNFRALQTVLDMGVKCVL